MLTKARAPASAGDKIRAITFRILPLRRCNEPLIPPPPFPRRITRSILYVHIYLCAPRKYALTPTRKNNITREPPLHIEAITRLATATPEGGKREKDYEYTLAGKLHDKV